MIHIFRNIINVFTNTVDQFNASLLNKNLTDTELLNGTLDDLKVNWHELKATKLKFDFNRAFQCTFNYT